MAASGPAGLRTATLLPHQELVLLVGTPATASRKDETSRETHMFMQTMSRVLWSLFVAAVVTGCATVLLQLAAASA